MIRHYREHQYNIQAKLSAQRGRTTQAELLGWMDSLSNWGRWGADDQRGTLNLVTPDVTLQGDELGNERREESDSEQRRLERAAGFAPMRQAGRHRHADAENKEPARHITGHDQPQAKRDTHTGRPAPHPEPTYVLNPMAKGYRHEAQS